ncbi:MAG: hypothetical protein JRN20_07695 [Nitrososphaerota archaeon]|jgi:hypothetical protein|nr:hypothetical protein [Nitrososphaerota archaeon]MDG6924363.1 hypothetical protein [Nitrososphaerota archaeon]
MSSNEGTEKRNLISIKGQTVTKQDYRGILAIMLVAAFIYVVILGANCESTAALGTLTGAAVTYYFDSRSKSD